jgi:hypothetical protein
VIMTLTPWEMSAFEKHHSKMSVSGSGANPTTFTILRTLQCHE